MNRRESALRRAEEARADEEVATPRCARVSALSPSWRRGIKSAEARERELERTVGAVETQRDRLDAVRAEYESRRDVLMERTQEVEAERDRAPHRSRPASLRRAWSSMTANGRLAALEQTARRTAAKPKPTDADWWAKQLGAPLEAA